MPMNGIVYGFPFWIYIDRKDPPKEVVLQSNIGDIRVYPPFRSSPGNFNPFPKIDITKIPGIKYRIEGGVPLPPSPVIVRSLGLGQNASQNIHVVADESYDHLPQDNFPMDSLRLDYLGEEPYAEARAQYVRNLLNIIRWKTNQWWINRSMESLTGFYSGQSFQIDRDGKPQGAPGTIFDLSGAGILGVEIPLNSTLWTESIEASAYDFSVPDYESLFLDAAHYLAIGDLHLAVLNLMAACEQAKNRTYTRLWSERYPNIPYNRDDVQGNWDVRKHLDSKLKRYFGASYKDSYPEEWPLICDLWDARGNVAHGAACTYGDPPIKVDIIKTRDFFFATRRCIDWLLSL